MTQDRSVKFSDSGKFEGILSTGDNAKNAFQKGSNTPEDYLNDFQKILEQLAQRYPDAPNSQKQIVLQMELQQKMKADPTFKERFVSAVKAGGIELIKVLTNNPFVSVPLETIKGWIEAESR